VAKVYKALVLNLKYRIGGKIMKLTKGQKTKLTEMAFEKKSNKEIAEVLGIKLTDVHAARSRLGITIPKVEEALSKGAKQPVASRTKAEIEQEIEKVQKARTDAFRKVERCNDRIDHLYIELQGAR